VLVAGAVCPHPPLLVPELAGGAAPELDALRAACDEAVRRLLAARPDLVVVVGAAQETVPLPPSAAADLHPYGGSAAIGGGPGPERLPLPHTIGAWLLDRAGYTGPQLAFGVSDDRDGPACATLGAALVTRAPRTALLAMGDASARRGPKAPGYLDERAQPFDDSARALLAAGDATGMLELDPQVARELLVAGRMAWQVLAGAVDGPVDAELLAAEAPYGVAYLVASWVPRDEVSPR
jgi:hypothetical protein